MLKDIKISTKLLLISIITVLGLAILSYVSINSSVVGKSSLETIYEKNVVPDNEISIARSTFETILNDLIHVTSEFLPTGQAKDRILVTEKKMNEFFAKALKSDFYDDPVLKQNLNEAYKMYTEKIVPKKFATIAGNLLLLHGRYTCVARKPKCKDCVVNNLCRYAFKTS